ncbi:Uncharacterised protein [Yersinia thracica]|uniref:Uncharacterized protein n=1 Tax=Yersinia thracica TaxID=2890319 RepID=A0A0T9NWU2_9GAMM|nr:Uncharacterised protein [Yersinia thracica]
MAITAMTVRTIISVELNQSSSLPWSSMICRAPIPTTNNTNPTVSIGLISVLVSRPFRVLPATKMTTTPMGMLIKKIQPQ